MHAYILQVYAWAGFVLSVIWIYAIANEIVNLLQVILCYSLCACVINVTIMSTICMYNVKYHVGFWCCCKAIRWNSWCYIAGLGE